VLLVMAGYAYRKIHPAAAGALAIEATTAGVLVTVALR